MDAVKCALILAIFSEIALAADTENQDPSLSAGGISALVLLVVFSIILVGSCIYQSRRSSTRDEPQHRILRCGGCRRAFRVTAAVEGADFMCSRCVTEGRRRMSVVLEEERVARFARMRESANKSIKLERVTSTFFKIAPMRSKSGIPTTTTPAKAIPASSMNELPTLSRQPTEDAGGECKICFDDQSCIVLVPCGHSGICEGCAKDLVTLTKECYICRNEIELIAKIRKPGTPIMTRTHSTESPNQSTLFRNQMSALYVAPDTLHHLASRRNTVDDNASFISRRHTMESLPEELPVETTEQSSSPDDETEESRSLPILEVLPV